jgi:two-component system, cell cycle response regulator
MDDRDLRRRFEAGTPASVAAFGALITPPDSGTTPQRTSNPRGIRAFWQPPDPVFVEAGAEGEWAIARLRILIVALLVITPVYRSFRYPEVGEYTWGLVMTGVAGLVAVGIFFYLRRGEYRPWMGFASSTFDVTLVSAALLAFLLVGPPHVAVNSKVTFEVYFLAIMATSLRYDRRICVAAGLLAMVQYGAIVLSAMTFWDMDDPAYMPWTYGRFIASDQLTRFIILGATTLLASETVRRAQRLRYLSTHDRLTGLSNRRYLEERATIEIERARRHGRVVSVAMVDVDHFKKFNDTYGHTAGDAVLRMIASTLRESVRSSDIVARYGGEEFVLLFPEAGEVEALERLDSIRERISASRIVLPGTSAPLQITVSGGLAMFPTDGRSIDAVIGTADTRLFEAKQAGRDRVVGRPGLRRLKVEE